ncbi:MAG: DNA polymerase II, partial [Pseudomonadales bacterium]
MNSIFGFVLTRHQQDQPSGIELRYWIKTEQGTSLVSIAGQESVFFVHDEFIEAVNGCLNTLSGWRLEKVKLNDLEQRGVHGLYCLSLRTQREVIERLTLASIPMMEEDIRPVDRFLMERFIFGGVEVIHNSASASASASSSSSVPRLKP